MRSTAENHHMPDEIARQHIKPEIETVLNASLVTLYLWTPPDVCTSVAGSKKAPGVS